MLTRVALLDALTPAVAAWLQDMNPASARALQRAGLLIRRAAVVNIRGAFRRTGRNRTFGGQRGVRMRLDQSAGIRTMRIWHSSGILAAHELGATVPAVTIRPRGKRVLAWGGPPGGPHTKFARVIHRRGFTLRRRPTLGPAYASNASAVYEFLEAEYQRVLDQAPPAVTT